MPNTLGQPQPILGVSLMRPDQTYKPLVYSSDSFKDYQALWNPERKRLEVGLFVLELTRDERILIAENKSLQVAESNIPAVKLVIEFQPESEVRDLSTMSLCEVQFNIHGTTGSASCGGPQENNTVAGRLTKLVCDLEGGRKVQGEMNGSFRLAGAAMSSSGENWDVQWDTFFSADVIDVSLEHSRRVALIYGLPVVPEGFIGRGQVDRNFVNLSDSVALYNAVYHHVSVGFYSQQLSDREKEEVRIKKSITYAVNGKRPNLVLVFSVRPGTRQISPSAVEGYVLYFQRDNRGEFYFPGQFDSESFERKDAGSVAAEVRQLSGNLVEGGSISGLVQGFEPSSRRKRVFSWTLNFTTQVMSVE